MSDYLSAEALKNLQLYKYSAVDKSLITKYVLSHYWSWAVTLFPLWMAFALGIWLYSTFDNVDGKQARRTQSSSPLGELFDHGCDAINCSIGALVQATSLGLGFTSYSGAVALLTTVAFYFSTWEEYHTGTLYLGLLNGPTEGILIACIMSIISGIYGPFFWHQLGSHVLPLWISNYFPLHFTLIDYCLFMFTFLLITTQIPFSISKVYLQCRSPHRKYSFRSAMLQLVPMGLFLTCNSLWLTSPFSTAMKNHFILFIVANGVVFGRMATKIILAHVTKMPFPMFSTNMLFPLIIGTTLIRLPHFTGSVILSPHSESIFIYCYFIAAILNYFHWALLVIHRFCEHLDIFCLTLKQKNIQVNENGIISSASSNIKKRS
ncbi:hypothetical protein HMI55_007012 [Coelomomyces lativittatus]|nr:hypothetical protein HMI55_007012 [Coelomomyces lativittatus]